MTFQVFFFGSPGSGFAGYPVNFTNSASNYDRNRLDRHYIDCWYEIKQTYSRVVYRLGYLHNINHRNEARAGSSLGICIQINGQYLVKEEDIEKLSNYCEIAMKQLIENGPFYIERNNGIHLLKLESFNSISQNLDHILSIIEEDLNNKISLNITLRRITNDNNDKKIYIIEDGQKVLYAKEGAELSKPLGADTNVNVKIESVKELQNDVKEIDSNLKRTRIEVDEHEQGIKKNQKSIQKINNKTNILTLLFLLVIITSGISIYLGIEQLNKLEASNSSLKRQLSQLISDVKPKDDNVLYVTSSGGEHKFYLKKASFVSYLKDNNIKMKDINQIISELSNFIYSESSLVNLYDLTENQIKINIQDFNKSDFSTMQDKINGWTNTQDAKAKNNMLEYIEIGQMMSENILVHKR